MNVVDSILVTKVQLSEKLAELYTIQLKSMILIPDRYTVYDNMNARYSRQLPCYRCVSNF